MEYTVTKTTISSNEEFLFRNSKDAVLKYSSMIEDSNSAVAKYQDGQHRITAMEGPIDIDSEEREAFVMVFSPQLKKTVVNDHIWLRKWDDEARGCY